MNINKTLSTDCRRVYITLAMPRMLIIGYVAIDLVGLIVGVLQRKGGRKCITDWTVKTIYICMVGLLLVSILRNADPLEIAVTYILI